MAAYRHACRCEGVLAAGSRGWPLEPGDVGQDETHPEWQCCRSRRGEETVTQAVEVGGLSLGNLGDGLDLDSEAERQ